MRVVIAGGGSVGRFIAEQLRANGDQVTVIESDRGLVERYHDRDEVTWVAGDACELAVLRRAGTLEADVVAAVTGDDEDNLVVSLLAKQEFGVGRVIARVNNPRNEWMFDETWGVDVAVSAPHVITGLVQEAVTVGSFVRLLSFGRGEAKIAEVRLAEGSPAADREIAQLGLPRDASIVAVLRDGRVIVPRGDTVLRGGDEVVVLVTPSSEASVTDVLVGGA